MLLNEINENNIDCKPLRDQTGDHYHNWIAWKMVDNSSVLTLQYVSFSTFYYVLILLIVIGFIFIPPLIDNQKLWVVIKFAMVSVSFVFLLIYYLINKSHSRKGDWFIYDKKSKMIRLPRVNIEVEKDDLVCMQIIIGDPDFSDSLLDTQLNVVVINKNRYKRYPLMRALTPRVLWNDALKLCEQLSCPCQIVEYGINRKCKKRWEKRR